MRRFFWFPLVFRFLTRFWDGVARSCVPKKNIYCLVVSIVFFRVPNFGFESICRLRGCFF